MMDFDLAKIIGELDEESRLRFYEYLAHDLTIAIRGVWSDETLTDAEKVDQIKWINEIQHRVTSKVYTLRRHTHEWTEEDFQNLIEGFSSQNRSIASAVESAVRYAHKAVVFQNTGLTCSVEERLRRVLEVHFDPERGTPYWLEVAARLGFDPRARIQTIDDLALLGPMDQDALAVRPVEDFIPRALLARRAEFILAETGGTLGAPKFAVHRRDEFHAAFIAPFLAAARLAGFPRGEPWLFVGPSGPHIIGVAARACAVAMGSPEPFTVDFDPRWAKKLPEGSFGLGRYRTHIQEQALRILRTQRVGVIFSTPPVIDGLGEQLDDARRAAILGIHFGGMAVGAELLARLRALFPNAVMLAGYGNTLLGMVPELAAPAGESGIHYYPQGHRLILRVVPLNDGVPDAERIPQQAAPGERGQVLAHRLDETQLIVNLLERDTARRLGAPGEKLKDEGFYLEGIADPQPLVQGASKPALGLY